MTETGQTETGQQAAPDAGAVQPEQGQQAEQERALPESEVRRIMAKEKREGKQSATREVLEALGFEDLDTARNYVSQYREIEQELESEGEREKAARERAEAQAKDARERWINTERRYALRDAFRDKGLTGQQLNDAIGLANLDEITVDAKTGTVEGIEEVVDAVLEPRPYLLADSEPETRQRVGAPPVRETGQQATGVQPEATRENMAGGFLGWLTDPIPEEGDTFP